MRIGFGTDEGTDVTDALVGHLEAAGHEVVRLVDDGTVWTDVGRVVGEAVAAGEVDRGVVVCFTGTGVSIAANKVAGIRAALCTDAETTRMARTYNDANVLALGLRLTTAPLGAEMLDAFLGTDVGDGEGSTIAELD